jgi:hypothetical protein
MKTAALLLTIVCPLTLLAGEVRPPTAEKLLAETIKSPGSFGQICDPPRRVDAAIPLPLFETALLRDFNVSAERMTALRTRRAEVIPALKKLLVTIEPGLPPPPVAPQKLSAPGGEDGDVLSSGISPRQISGLLLQIVLELEAVEALPELLDLEERLRAALERASNDRKAITPSVANDGSYSLVGRPELSKRDREMVRCRIVQREMLSLMLQLLRHQHFAPMLESEFEKTYAQAIIARAEKNPDSGRNGERPWIDFDPIHKVKLGFFENPPSVPFSRDVRETARGLVKEFIAQTTKESKVPQP